MTRARLPRRRVRANGVRLAVADRGRGPAVVLLHGFPDTADLWAGHAAALAAADHRVLAPDLRGFGDSDRPDWVEAYRLEELVGDVVGLLDASGIDRAHVVGHDWGAILAWAVAAFEPDRVDRLVAVSVGHPSWIARPVPEQLGRSWYVGMFLLEGVAERVLRAANWAVFRAMFRGTDTERAVELLSRPGALTAALGVYRANLRSSPSRPARVEVRQVPGPVLGIRGARDFALGEWQMARSGQHVDGLWRYERLDGIGHWPMLEDPPGFDRLVLGFLAGR